MRGKYPKFGVTGQQGFKLSGKFGNLTRYETKLKPFQFGYGTIWATSERGAKIKLKKAIVKDRKEMEILRSKY